MKITLILSYAGNTITKEEHRKFTQNITATKIEQTMEDTILIMNKNDYTRRSDCFFFLFYVFYVGWLLLLLFNVCLAGYIEWMDAKDDMPFIVFSLRTIINY